MELSKTQIVDATNFLIQYLKDSGFEGDVENGTAIHDLLIKPMSILYTLFKMDVDKSYGYLSLDKAVALKDILGADYDTAVDSILSNWFVTRGTGKTTTGVIRAYFSKPLTSIYIDSNTVFTANSINLQASAAKLYVISDFVTFYNTVRNITEYYIDIPVVSTQTTSKLITTTDAVTGTISNLFYTRAEVAVAFDSGKAPETSEEFIARTKDVITTRELVSEKAITTVLLDSFPYLQRIYVAGYGSAEQVRDLVAIGNVYAHIGNKIDIYIQTPLIKKTLKASTYVTTIDYVKILSVVNTSTNLPVSYTLTDTTITVASTINYTVTYLQSTDFASVKNYMSGSVACCDLKICYPEVKVLNVGITVKVANLSVVPADIKSSMFMYVNNLQHASNYSVLDMVRNLKVDVPGVIDVIFPLTITSDGTAFTYTDSNIVQLYTDDSYITVTVTQ